MSNNVFKNLQVNIGMPMNIYTQLNKHDIKQGNKQLKFEENINPEGIADISLDLFRKKIIVEARKKASSIIKEAIEHANVLTNKAEIESIEKCLSMQVSKQEGYNEGYSKGYSEGKAIYEGLLQEAQEIKNQGISEYNELLANAESDFISMIMDITQKVIGYEIEINKENVLILVKNAIEKCTNKDNLLLKVSEVDYEFIVENTEKLRNYVDGIGEIEVRIDSSLNAGNCIVDSPFGSVDSSIDTKFNKIKESFLRIIEQAGDKIDKNWFQ